MHILAQLFGVFAKIGLFTFGGGYAMISLIENACVEQKKWITHDDMMNITVIAESTPGPIAINCATFVGYKQAGICGAVAATLGMVTPSFVIIYLISMFLEHFMEIALVAHAFQGIKAAVGLLILDAGITMLKKMPAKVFPRAMAGGAFAVMLLVDLLAMRFSSIALMVVAAAVSLGLFALQHVRAGKDGDGR